MAETMARVVHRDGCIFPKDNKCEEETVYALMAIAHHESGFASDVQDCSRCKLGGPYCDHGKAISIYQMHSNNWEGHTRQEVCTDLGLSTELALKALKKAKGSWASKFRTYAGRKESGQELFFMYQTIHMMQSRKSGS